MDHYSLLVMHAYDLKCLWLDPGLLSHALWRYLHFPVFVLFIGTSVSGIPSGVFESVLMGCWLACIIICSSIVGNTIHIS